MPQSSRSRVHPLRGAHRFADRRPRHPKHRLAAAPAQIVTIRGVAPVLMLVLLLGPGLAGCGASTPRAEPAHRPQAEALRHEVVSNAGNYRVRFLPVPDPIPLNEVFGLLVLVEPVGAGAKEAALGSLRLVADAAMPEHRHGMVRTPRVEPLGEGSFQVEGLLFHMPGRWELYFDITVGRVTERAQFEVNLD